MDNTINTTVILEKHKIKKLVQKNMVLFLMGQLVSLFGTSIYNFAIGLYILKETGSALNFAFSLALGALPQVLFGPIAGVAADRLDRKKMVVYLDILSGLVVLGLLGISMVDGLRLSYIYLATFLLTTCNTFFSTPLNSSIPNIVDDENLTKINSLSQSAHSICSIAGPAIGGVIFFIDIRVFLLINGLSFILSGISEMFIDFRLKDKVTPKTEVSATIEAQSTEETKEPQKFSARVFLEDFKDGLKYIVSHKWLGIMAAFALLLNLLTMIGLHVPVPYIVNEVWGFSSRQFGFFSMTLPVGMLVGSLILSVLPEAKSNFKRMVICIWIVSTMIITIGLVTSEIFFSLSNTYYLVILMVQYFTLALALIFFNVPLNVTLQRLIPDEKRGRIFGTLGTMSAALSPIGAIVGGLLVDRIKPWTLPIVCGIAMLFLAFYVYNTKELREEV